MADSDPLHDLDGHPEVMRCLDRKRPSIDRPFGALGIEHVRAQTMVVNAGSRRVTGKCGLRHVRTFYLTFDDPLPGTGQGEVEYGILRED